MGLVPEPGAFVPELLLITYSCYTTRRGFDGGGPVEWT